MSPVVSMSLMSLHWSHELPVVAESHDSPLDSLTLNSSHWSPLVSSSLSETH